MHFSAAEHLSSLRVPTGTGFKVVAAAGPGVASLSKFTLCRFPTNMPIIEELRSLQQLEQSRLLWNSLLVQSTRATFFQTLDWALLSLEQMVDQVTPRVLCVYQNDGTPIGILPLVETQGSASSRVIQWMPFPNHSTFRPIGRQCAATLIAGFKHLRDQATQWDHLELPAVHSSEWDRGRTLHALQLTGLPVVTSDRRPQLKWVSQFKDDLSTNHNTLSADSAEFVGPATWQRGQYQIQHVRPQASRYGDGDLHTDAFEACLEIARQSGAHWYLGPLLESNPDRESVIWRLHETASAQGAVDLHLLRLNDRPVGFVYSLHAHGTQTVVGYGVIDGALHSELWDLLQCSLIRQAVACQDHCIELPSDGLWEQMLSCDVCELVDYRVQSPSSSSRRLSRWGQWFKRAAGR